MTNLTSFWWGPGPQYVRPNHSYCPTGIDIMDVCTVCIRNGKRTTSNGTPVSAGCPSSWCSSNRAVLNLSCWSTLETQWLAEVESLTSTESTTKLQKMSNSICTKIEYDFTQWHQPHCSTAPTLSGILVGLGSEWRNIWRFLTNIRTRDIPDPHGDVPLPNLAEIESDCGHNVFTPL